MNTFAWNITLKGNKLIPWLDYDFIANLSKTGDKVIFIFGDTEFKTPWEIIDDLKEQLGEIKNYDISISTEDRVEILNSTYEEWVYEIATFEWEQVDFNEILERFNDFEEVVSIREAEISAKFWNKVIKVDFVY